MTIRTRLLETLIILKKCTKLKSPALDFSLKIIYNFFRTKLVLHYACLKYICDRAIVILIVKEGMNVCNDLCKKIRRTDGYITNGCVVQRSNTSISENWFMSRFVFYLLLHGGTVTGRLIGGQETLTIWHKVGFKFQWSILSKDLTVL